MLFYEKDTKTLYDIEDQRFNRWAPKLGGGGGNSASLLICFIEIMALTAQVLKFTLQHFVLNRDLTNYDPYKKYHNYL